MKYAVSLLIIATFVLTSAVFGATVKKTKGQKFLFHDRQMEFSKGDEVSIRDQRGKVKGTATITKIRGHKIIARIESGSVLKGDGIVLFEKADKDELFDDSSENQDDDAYKDSVTNPSAAVLKQDYPSESQAGKNLNFRTSPLGHLIGFHEFRFDYALGTAWTLGAQYTALDFSSDDFDEDPNALKYSVDGYTFGARFQYYLSGRAMTDSWLVSTEAGVMKMNVVDTIRVSGSIFGSSFVVEDTLTYDIDVQYVEAAIGYQWVWNNGFNIDLGLGGVYYKADASTANSTLVDDFDDSTYTAEINMGWAF